MENLPDWILDAIKNLGVAGGPVFALFWFLEYKQRVKSQTDLLRKTETFIKSTNDVASALDNASEAIKSTQLTATQILSLTQEALVLVRSMAKRR